VTTVADLVAAGRLERVPADAHLAGLRLATAEKHLATAAGLVGVDNDVAYTTLYDAARKAITAHMLANGLRAKATARAHEAVGVYAEERVMDPTGSIRGFQAIRRRRNKSEYQDLSLGELDVIADLAHAPNIVTAVKAAL